MTSQLKNLHCTSSIVQVNDFTSTTSTVSLNLTRKLPNCQRSKLASYVTLSKRLTNWINHCIAQSQCVNDLNRFFIGFYVAPFLVLIRPPTTRPPFPYVAGFGLVHHFIGPVWCGTSFSINGPYNSQKHLLFQSF